MSKKDGFYLYFDWERPFDRLNDEELGKITRAMMKYVKHRIEPPEFDGNAAIIADFVFPQLARSIQYAQNGALGGKKTQEKPTVEPMVEPTVEPINININIDKDKDKDKNTDTYSPSCEGTGDGGGKFDRFWSAYPKKVGKKDAQGVFSKLKPTETLFSRMLEVIEKQKQSEQWKREGGRYIPNPATWLRQGRWDDEITDEGSAENERNGTNDEFDFSKLDLYTKL